MVYLNCALIYWLGKKQTSVESFSFGSEFIAMKQYCEYIHGLWYKLRMMGILVQGPTYIYGDNKSVLANTMILDSTLKKKSQSNMYHFVHEGATKNKWRTMYVNMNDNESDLLTKIFPSGKKHQGFVHYCYIISLHSEVDHTCISRITWFFVCMDVSMELNHEMFLFVWM